MIVVIPARIGSTRLRRKLLLPYYGSPIICHAVMNALASDAEKVYVAAKDPEIYIAVNKYIQNPRLEVVMTKDDKCGTDGVAQVVEKFGLYKWEDIIVNLQGDEPNLRPEFINIAGKVLNGTGYQIGTIASPESEPFRGVKVVVGQFNDALYFSRENIPHGGPYLRHIGIYIFRGCFFKEYKFLPQYIINRGENLEQLKWLENGFKIKIHQEKCTNISIDTLEDYEKLIGGKDMKTYVVRLKGLVESKHVDELAKHSTVVNVASNQKIVTIRTTDDHADMIRDLKFVESLDLAPNQEGDDAGEPLEQQEVGQEQNVSDAEKGTEPK